MAVLLPTRRRLAALFLVLAGVCAAPLAAAPSAAERAAFKQAWPLAQQGGDAWRAAATGLDGYPLYPWLEAAAMRHDVATLDADRVAAWLVRHPDQLAAEDLRRAFLAELARRGDWTHFAALYRPGLGAALDCQRLNGRRAAGQALDFERDLAALWQHANLPPECDPVLDAARAQGLLTAERLWARIDRAVAAGQGGTVASLARWLPAPGRDSAQQLAQALRDPAAALAAAPGWEDAPRQREAVVLALTRRARRAVAAAEQAWQALEPRFAFSPAQRDAVLAALALYHATDFSADALQRLAALPAAAQTDATREWRVRVALARGAWAEVLAGIEAMPAAQQADGEWRWFRARALAELGRPEDARDVLATLAGEATYHGFLAADRLDRAYAICPLAPPADAARRAQLAQRPGLVRAFELFAVGLPDLARREWARALAGSDATTRALAVELAGRAGWYDRAVFTFSSGEALRYYAQRFPLASQDGLVPAARSAGVAADWAYAILRAESAWMSDAHSAADARGLMQLLPATAARVAKKYGLAWKGADALYDPRVNIALGTRYLADMAARFDGSPWLASAAYNAGPGKVEQWLAARGTLAPDVFIATMPYRETREYVARVMAFSVIYDWRLDGASASPLRARLGADSPEPAPAGPLPRRPVACPAAPEAPAAPATTAGAAP